MNLDEHDMRVAFRCVSELLDTRRLRGVPIPRWLIEHYRRIEAAYRSMATLGHQPGSDQRSSDNDELVSARQAAAIIGLSRRHVQRLSADLDGRIIDGRWLYPLDAVRAYREGRQQH
ncbi:MAG: hypothetical protein ACRET2_17680 [Steroidobacteraceae bacterium]